MLLARLSLSVLYVCIISYFFRCAYPGLLPENDIWIAAIALQHDLILVTRDAHFQEVENLQTAMW
jgi:predicted nucleic acid-binding protein